MAAVTDIVVGPYPYWVEDSLLMAPNSLHWYCSNPEWTITTAGNGYRGYLWPGNIGEGTITARTDDIDCDTVFSINVHATWFDLPEQELTNIKVYPNPAQRQVTIEVPEIIQIRLIDALGQTLINKKYKQSDSAVLDISHLPMCVYLLEITTKSSRTVRRLVVD